MHSWIKMQFDCRVQQQYEEERLQRLVQEEAVKFLWKEVSTWSLVLKWSVFVFVI